MEQPEADTGIFEEDQDTALPDDLEDAEEDERDDEDHEDMEDDDDGLG